MASEGGTLIERRRRRLPTNENANRITGEYLENGWFLSGVDGPGIVHLDFRSGMQRGVKTALIALAILVCVVVITLLLNVERIKSGLIETCINQDVKESCHSTTAAPYRFYGTKTAYHVASSNNVHVEELNTEGCEPKIFYLLCRHATRYPDEDQIKHMIKQLPMIKEKLLKNTSQVKFCKEDLENLKNEEWYEKIKPEFGNKITQTGIKETAELAKRFKAKFPSVLDRQYVPEDFIFEYTSRERTRTTAEAFANGLFEDDSKKINFENRTNDEVLQFHKQCKKMQKNCNSTNYDLSEIEKFENGSLMQKVISSVSERTGLLMSYDDIDVIYRACVFGFALEAGDAWCSLFSTDDLKVLEFNDDIDDYYKDAYGNRINHEQACPAVEHIMNIFNTLKNSPTPKAILQFSHAGGVKKVFASFGLFKDEKPLTAGNFCLQQNRRWRSSLVAPFTANLALVLYSCGAESKIAAFHNEKPVLVEGCSSALCPFEEFHKTYNPVAEDCDLKGICSSCFFEA